MAYTTPNFKTKKLLRKAIQSDREITVFQPGPFGGNIGPDDRVTLEGPHYPAPHTWYAIVQLKDGVIDRLVS